MHPALLALAFVLHAIAGFLILVGGLIMPVWALVVLGVIWVGLLVVMILRRHRRGWVFTMPIVSVALWFGAAFLGETFLDWTA